MKIVLKNPPIFMLVGKKKPKKVYLTQNSLNSRNHFMTVEKVLNFGKDTILEQYNNTYALNPCPPEIKPNSICVVLIKTKKKITQNVNYDIDNRGNYWTKVFLDLLQYPVKKVNAKGKEIVRNPQGLKLLLNDNAFWIKGIVEFYQKSDEEAIEFILSDKVKILIPNDVY